MTTWQAAFIGLLQGATELFPVSSLGHAVILPSLLHWSYRQSDPTFLPFLVLLHLGTAGALLILYWRDWVDITRGFFSAAIRGSIQAPNERLAMLLVVGTVPTGLVGVFFQKQFQALFANPRVAAGFLIVNGALLLGAELLRRRAERRARLEGKDRAEQEEAFTDVSNLSYRAAGLVGLCQVLALFPGISRSGVTMGGGLLAGLRHREAARFSFLLATPIIAGAGVLELPKLIHHGADAGISLSTAVAGGIVAAVTAYASTAFLMYFFKRHDFQALNPFAYYCLAAGLVAVVLLSGLI
jgi:undecaprenyl-diphosphatase